MARPAASTGTAAVGIDLGLKDFASCSDGTKVDIEAMKRMAEQMQKQMAQQQGQRASGK